MLPDRSPVLFGKGPSAFSSRREVWLAALLLSASVLILYLIVAVQFDRPARIPYPPNTPAAATPG